MRAWRGRSSPTLEELVMEDPETDAAELARAVAGFVGHPDAEPMSLDAALDLLGTELTVALVAGVVATSGEGDAA